MPTFSTLAALPAPIGSSGSVQGEYPRAIALSDTLWAVSSGFGSVYLLRVSDVDQPFSGEFTARHDLPEPFQLYAAHDCGNGVYKLLIARPVVQEEEGGKFKPRKVTFDLCEVEVSGSATNGIDANPEVLQPKWSLNGRDLPYHATWSDEGWIVLSEETFGEAAKEKKTETETERTARKHLQKIDRLGLGATLPESERLQAPEEEEEEEEMDVDDKPYPFSWSQDSSSVTITVPVPGMSRKDINVDIKADKLSLSVSSNVEPPLSAFTGRDHALWSNIIVDESTWTYDADKAEVEITLQKGAEDTMRWPSVFVPGDDDDDDSDDVPETFGASTLAAIRNSFSHARQTDTDEPQDNPPALPALLRETMDIEFDDDEDTEGQIDATGGSVGRATLIGFIRDGEATWSRQQTSVLSLPANSDGIIVKSAVDGLLFAPPTSDTANPARTPWTHLATIPALAFIMSSKRDLRLVRHVTSPQTTVFAFDSGSGTGNGNVYVYYQPVAGDKVTTARQGVVSVSGGERGALLGVSCITGDRPVVVALCEHELVVLDGLLDQ